MSRIFSSSVYNKESGGGVVILDNEIMCLKLAS